MYLLEYQGKELFAQRGIPIPRGVVVSEPSAAQGAMNEVGSKAVVKAQVRAGGRGKAGLVKVADSPEEAVSLAGKMLGAIHKGEKVEKLLLEEPLNIKEEFYLGVSLDYAQGLPVILLSTRGGVDIESVAQNEPEALAKLTLDATTLPPLHVLMDLGRSVGLKGKKLLLVRDMLRKIVKLFYEMDAVTVEINPAVWCEDGRFMAADAKVIIDDAGVGKHQELTSWKKIPDDPSQREAHKFNLGYVRLDEDGEVGIIAGGAGLCLASMDTVRDLGAKPASFLDLGGGITPDQMAAALEITLHASNVQGIIVNVYGGINNCYVMAQGIVKALGKLTVKKTALVVKMRGHSQDEGWKLLEENNITIVKHGTTQEAIEKLLDNIDITRGQA